MNDCSPVADRDLPPDPARDIPQQIAALRLAGGGNLDPVRFHHLELLVHRADAQTGRVKQLLEAKVTTALRALNAGPEPTRPEPVPTRADGGLRPIASLRDLVHQLEQNRAQQAGRALVDQPTPGFPTETKAAQYFRNTWSRISVDKRVTQALVQAPKNAGPINSHGLVLRSLARMQEISPDYLNRITSYVDTLLCLDESRPEKQPLARKVADTAGSSKPKPRRPRSR